MEVGREKRKERGENCGNKGIVDNNKKNTPSGHKRRKY